MWFLSFSPLNRPQNEIPDNASCQVIWEVKPVERGAEDCPTNKEAAQELKKGRSPQLQELKQAGGQENSGSDKKRSAFGKNKENNQAPENNIKQATQGVADPLACRPVIEFCVKPQWRDKDDQQQCDNPLSVHFFRVKFAVINVKVLLMRS
jgi:hypothetical protein